MTIVTGRLSIMLLGLAFVSSAFGQFGGGGRGGPGGGANNGAFGSNNGPQLETSLAGSWMMEFEIAFDSGNPEASGASTTIRADVTVTGIEVNGRFRHPAQGEFTCTVYEGSPLCEAGRMLIVWPDQDLQESAAFEFVVDQFDGRRAKGEATFTTGNTAAVRVFTVRMRKR